MIQLHNKFPAAQKIGGLIKKYWDWTCEN